MYHVLVCIVTTHFPVTSHTAPHRQKMIINHSFTSTLTASNHPWLCHVKLYHDHEINDQWPEQREVLQETRESDDIAASHHHHAVDLVTGPELRNNLMMIKHLLFVTLLVQSHIHQQSRSSPTREMQFLRIYNLHTSENKKIYWERLTSKGKMDCVLKFLNEPHQYRYVSCLILDDHCHNPSLKSKSKVKFKV